MITKEDGANADDEHDVCRRHAVLQLRDGRNRYMKRVLHKGRRRQTRTELLNGSSSIITRAIICIVLLLLLLLLLDTEVNRPSRRVQPIC
jgi:hypothetical protein